MAPGLFESMSRYSKVEEATSTKDDAPPVYLMDEIVEFAKESSEAADAVAEHINKRLCNRSPVVRWKVRASGEPHASATCTDRTPRANGVTAVRLQK
eukprot:366469-Chlamydomonas_euryale.AAC.3